MAQVVFAVSAGTILVLRGVAGSPPPAAEQKEFHESICRQACGGRRHIWFRQRALGRRTTASDWAPRVTNACRLVGHREEPR